VAILDALCVCDQLDLAGWVDRGMDRRGDPRLSSGAVSEPQATPELGPISFSPGGEQWIEFGPPAARRRIGFHDYAELYAVPGLYERVFYEELGMCSASEVVNLLAETLAAEALDPADLRVLDFGAGNGAGGEELRRIGVRSVVGLDLEPAAAVAARRDRPGVYDDFVVMDLGTATSDELAALAGRGFNCLVAIAALGFGHVPAAVLERALGLVPSGSLIAFPIADELLPDRAEAEARASGYPDLVENLLDGRLARSVAERPYRHRVTTTGEDHLALAVVARTA